MAALVPPELVRTVDSYLFKWTNLNIGIQITNVSDAKGGLVADLIVTEVSAAGKSSLLHSSRMDLMGAYNRNQVANYLKSNRQDVNWALALEQICWMTREAHRSGSPAVDLRDVDYRQQQRYFIYPYLMQRAGTILFADGGGGKSLIAMGLAITAASEVTVLGKRDGDAVPVMYLDWEATEMDHSERMYAIMRASGVQETLPIYYRRMTASLAESAPIVRREIEQLKVGFIIIDSLGAATGGDPESASASISMIMAARSFGLPWLGIDHVTKAAANGDSPNAKAKPFGSGYKANLARLTWGMEKVQGEGENVLTVMLKNYKTNAKFHKPRALTIEFEHEDNEYLREVHITERDPHDVPEFADSLSLKSRIIRTLRQRKMTLQEIGDALNFTDKTQRKQIQVRCWEMAKNRQIVALDDGYYGLYYDDGNSQGENA